MTPRILLTRFGSLGDVVLATPLIRVLGTAYPAAHITFVTKERWAPLVERTDVDRVVALRPRESVASLARRLDGPFDHRVDLHAGLRSAALRVALGGRWGVFRSHPARRRWMAWRHRTTPALLPVAERYFEAARAAGLEVASDGRPADVRPTDGDRAAARRIATAPYVVLCPGAAHANKRWPASHWSALARRLRDRGTTVVATGTDAERDLMRDEAVVDAFGLALGPTAALLAGARLVVANDSGLMHLATAVGGPVVALFGSTVPAFGYAPYRAESRVLERELACRPCTSHGGPRCPRGDHACLDGITPQAVYDAMEALAG